MQEESNTPVFLSVAAVKTVLFGFFSLLAGLTVLTHLAQLFGLTFGQYACTSLLVVLSVLIAIFIISKKILSRVTVNDRKVLFFVLILGIIGATLAGVIHRPDSDDYYYVPNAVYYSQTPGAKMGLGVHFFHADGEPFKEMATNTSSPYEYIQALLSYCTGIEYLFFYYLIFPGLVGFLIPLSYYFALSQFQEESSKWNVLGVLAIISAMLLMGETHRSIGNFSFARAFQGKVLFMAAGIPLFVAFSYEYFKRPSMLSWFYLLLISTSMTGLTTSALAMLPALSLILTLVYVCTASNNRRRAFFLTIPYLASLFYVIGMALTKLNGLPRGVSANLQIFNDAWPITFREHLGFLINPEIPLTPIIAIVSMAISLLFCRRRTELFLWTLFTVFLYLNPWVAPFLIGKLIPSNIYWRMFYLLPFPLAIGIGVSCVLTFLNRFFNTKLLMPCSIGCLLLLNLSHYPLHSASIFRDENGVRVDWPGYKLHPAILKAAREIIVSAPSGVMLAPMDIAGTVTLLSSKYPQIISRFEGLYTWLKLRGCEEEARLRFATLQFVDGSSQYPDAFKKIVLMHPDISSIVIKQSALNVVGIKEFLEQNRFVSYRTICDDLVLIHR